MKFHLNSFIAYPAPIAYEACAVMNLHLLRYEHFGEIGFGDPKREEG